MPKTIAGAFLITALCLAGCGGAEPQDHAQSKTMAGSAEPSTHVSTGVRCSDKDWQITFWSDATYTTPVGYMTCSCWQLEDLEGSTSNYNTLNYEDTCDLR